MHVRKKSKQLFYGVKSSSSSPGAPRIKADLTPDRNKHWKKKKWPTFKLLRFCRTLVTFISQQHACTTLTTILPCPSCHIFNITILYPFVMVDPSKSEGSASYAIPVRSGYMFSLYSTSLWDSEDRVLALRIEGHRVLDSLTIATWKLLHSSTSTSTLILFNAITHQEESKE